MNLAQTQDTPAARKEAVVQFLKRTAAEVSARSLMEFQSLEAWERQRPAALREVRYMLGLDPLPERTPLHAQVTGTLARPRYRIEKVVFQSLPGLYVTGNLYVPNEASGPLPTILYVCGHSPHPLGAKYHYQDRALWFVTHGYVCLVLDTLEFGEVAGIHHGIHDLNMWRWLSQGYTPAGVEVWNAIRALDYLETRPEVDRQKFGLTGISGGGATTWFTAAVEERIAVAAPVCSTYTVGSQADHWVASGQCDCIYFHNTFLRDLPLVGALIAPRPLRICSGQRDGDFPPDGYHAVYERAKRIYTLYGKPELIKELDDDVGHSDPPLFLQAARQWMNRHLKGDATPVALEPAPEPLPETAQDLACLARLPADAANYRIHDHFVPTARLQARDSLAEWQRHGAGRLTELKEKVFRWFPAEPIPFETQRTNSDGGWLNRYADYKDVRIASEPGVPLRIQLLRPRNAAPETPLLVYAKRAGDSFAWVDPDELLPLFGRVTVLILNPRLTEHPVTPYEYAEFERTASWVGRTVAGMQVWDILRAVRWSLEEEKLAPASVAVYGKGEMGILALYAALFEPRIQQVVLNEPPASHRQGPALLNVLRVTDIPEAAALFAPRRLTFVPEAPAAFDFTRNIYGLHGHAEQIGQAESLPEALEVWKYA